MVDASLENALAYPAVGIQAPAVLHDGLLA
jgi:hypothetical protein